MILNFLNWIIGILSGICGAIYFLISGGSYTAVDFAKCLCLGFLIFLVVWICICVLIWLFFISIALTINWKKDYTTLSPFYCYIFDSWHRYVCSLSNLRFHVKGLEKLPTDRKFLTVCNHRSNYDSFIQTVVLKGHHVAFISKPENFAIPFARNYMKRALYLSIDRENVRNALKTIMTAIDFIRSGTVNIGVFPEGTRSKTGELGPFKPGCLKVAEKAECPIVVCTVEGSEKIRKNIFWKKTDIYFEVIKVVQPEEFTEGTTVDVSDEIRKIMLEKLGK